MKPRARLKKNRPRSYPKNTRQNNMSDMLRVLFLFAVITTAFGCTCEELPSFEQVVQDASTGPSPYRFAKILQGPIRLNNEVGPFADVVYLVEVSTGCGNTQRQKVTTCNNGACCGVSLTIGETYAMPLDRNLKITRVSACQGIANIKTLTQAKIDLVGETHSCSPIEICVGGECVPRRCAPSQQGLCRAADCAYCDPDYDCINERCQYALQPVPPKCKGRECGPTELCLNGERCAPRRCSPIGCKAADCKSCDPGYVCINERCQPALQTISPQPSCKCASFVTGTVPTFEQAVEEANGSDEPYRFAKVLNGPTKVRRPSGILDGVEYKLSVNAGCGLVRAQKVTTDDDPACFGVALRVGETYAMPLFRNLSTSQISNCQVIPNIKTLTPSQIALVNDGRPCNPTELCFGDQCMLRRCSPRGCRAADCKTCDKGYDCIEGRCIFPKLRSIDEL